MSSDVPTSRLFLPTPSARRATTVCTADTGCRCNFYPRPPRGGRQQRCTAMTVLVTFLPTPSARRATAWPHRPAPSWADFYPRPPRGGRPSGPSFTSPLEVISTHALREEGDLFPAFFHRIADISTHALREEGDLCRRTSTHWSTNFYPRPPRGGRPRPAAASTSLMLFLPTPSARRATA